MRLALAGGLLGGLAILVSIQVDNLVDSSGVATAAPAIVIGFCSRLFAGRLKAPPVLLTAAGIIPLLPGLAVYQGLLALSQEKPNEGITFLVEAAGIAIALAGGVLLGQLLAGRIARAELPKLIPPREVERSARLRLWAARIRPGNWELDFPRRHTRRWAPYRSSSTRGGGLLGVMTRGVEREPQ
jgi:uncharacterized membrane protein YjjB (DUF3815 family)